MFELVVGSKHHAAGAVTALDTAGHEYLVIAAKATWSIPQPGARPRPLSPEPLVDTDQYHGEPGQSAMRYGSDFARHKARCDVLFDACAHPPEPPATEVIAAWRVGVLQKGLRAVGPRKWRMLLGVPRLTAPDPFERMPLHHGLAFGGTRSYRHGGQMLADVLPDNPAGIGWAGPQTTDQLHDSPAPSLEAVDDPVRDPRDKYAPVAFSPIARHWMPRVQLAGTYDEQWQRDVFPLLPHDFDEGFHQCAPADQQMPYPAGGEEVTLLHLLAGRPHVRFNLPRLNGLGMRVLRTDYSEEVLQPVVDTLFFEPDAGRFSAVWRASLRLRRRLQEIGTVVVGPADPNWWAAKRRGQEKGCAGCGPASGAAA